MGSFSIWHWIVVILVLGDWFFRGLIRAWHREPKGDG